MTSKTKLDFPKGKGNNYHIVIYVPSTRNIDQQVSEREFRKRIKSTVDFLRSKLGGSTRLSGIGNYYSDDLNRSVTERVAKIESFTTKSKYYQYDVDIEKFLKRKKKEWSQEWLSYEYNGKLFFI